MGRWNRRGGGALRRLRERALLCGAGAGDAEDEAAGAPARLLRDEGTHGTTEGGDETGQIAEAAGAPARVLQGEGVHGMMARLTRLFTGHQSEEEKGEEVEVAEESSPKPRLIRGNTQVEHDLRAKRKAELTGHDETEDEMWKLICKDKILEATTIADMFDTALEFIDEEWLGEAGDGKELPGNIYRIAALGTLLEGPPSLLKVVRMCGFCSICVLQLFGPPLLVLSAFYGWGTETGKGFLNNKSTEFSWTGADHKDLDTTKLLSCVFLFTFNLNGLYVLLDYKRSWARIHMTFRYLKHNTPNMDVTGGHFLILEAITNSWVVVTMCIASFVLIGSSISPRTLLFDALGLLFLYNLDDIDSSLGFVSDDDWDGERLGWIYREMVAVNYHPTYGHQTDTADKFDPEKSDWHGYLTLKLYDCVAVFLVITTIALPIAAYFTPFSEIMPEDWFDE